MSINFHYTIFTFSKQAILMSLLIYVTVHNLMKGINIIESCQAHLPFHSNSFARSDTGVVIDRNPTKPLIRLHFKYKTVLFA